MQRWQYLEVWTDGKNWHDSDGRDEDLPFAHSRYPSMTPLLNDLGEQGWEVVDSIRGYDSTEFWHQRLLLKRPRA
jgi:hypothetical protein